MGIRGLVVILLNFILNTFVWSSKNSKELSIERLICDTCGKLKSTDGMQHVFSGIYICCQCVDKILSLYVTSNPIRTLCPFCYGKEGNVEKCNYCDIKTLEHTTN